MRNVSRRILLGRLLGLSLVVAPWLADASPVVYSNLTVNGAMATASRPDTAGIEIESADDFVLSRTTSIDHATFIGLLPANALLSSIAQIRLEIYRVFPNDSNTARTPQVPTRVNSPSDVAFAERDSAAAQLTFSAAILNARFTAANSVQSGGIHALPNQTTGGGGAITGQEVQIDVDLLSPFLLAADHYFFIPQVLLANGDFFWLSASRPISGAGSTPFTPDLQSWIRDAALDPDWLRIGTDIVGGATPPTFNAAFALNGTAVPEPGTLAIVAIGALVAGLQRRRMRSR